MQADGFLSRRERHPVAMTAAIAINLGAVAALILVKSDVIIKSRPEAIPTIELFTPEEPPEVIPEPVKPRVDPPITAPRTVVERPLPPIRDVDPPIRPTELVSDFNLDGGGAIGGTGTGTITPPVEKPPVLTLAEVDPRYASAFQPPYPPKLQRLEIEGKVVLKVLIGADGRVKDVQIVSADDEDFAAVTERQARARWRFKPATRDGAGVESWKQLTVRFQIARG